MSDFPNRRVYLQSSSLKPHKVDRPVNFTWHSIDEIGHSFADDKIEKAGPISEWLWGEPRPKKVYHLKTTQFPFTGVGSQLAIRKSVVRAFMWAQERKSLGDKESLVKLAILMARLLTLIRDREVRAAVPEIYLWAALTQEIGKLLDEILDGQ